MNVSLQVGKTLTGIDFTTVGNIRVEDNSN